METEFAIINRLPWELIEKILENRKIAVNDVVQFSLTCKHFQLTNWSEKFWKTKLFQRWPMLREVYATSKSDESDLFDPELCWFSKLKKGVLLRNEFIQMFSRLSEKHFFKVDLSRRDLFNKNIVWDDFKTPIMIEEVHFLLNDEESDLTHRYYARKMLRYLRQEHVTHKWNQLASLPSEELKLESVGLLITEWFQPEERTLEAQYFEKINEIVAQVMELLKERYPSHTIFLNDKDLLKHWENGNIRNNQFEAAQSREILNCICDYLIKVAVFQTLPSNSCDRKDFYLNDVLADKSGNQLTLMIIFKSIASRLGLRCEIISYPNYEIHWRENYDSTKMTRCYKMNIFTSEEPTVSNTPPLVDGFSDYLIECPQKGNHVFESAEKIMRSIAFDLIKKISCQSPHFYKLEAKKAAVELLFMIDPRDIQALRLFREFYMKNTLDAWDLIKHVKALYKKATDVHYANEIKRFLAQLKVYMADKQFAEINCGMEPRDPREASVKYEIGHVLYNIKNYKYCVVLCWTRVYVTCQPQYYVIYNDGEIESVPENKLRLALPNEETDIDPDYLGLGRFFCKFDGLSFVPNEEMLLVFPKEPQVVEPPAPETSGEEPQRRTRGKHGMALRERKKQSQLRILYFMKSLLLKK